MKNVDLHMHSLCSDGLSSVAELIEKAKAKNLAAISITDHDSVEGYKDLDPSGHGIEILPGVELLSSAKGCAIEILVYGFDYKDMAEFIKINCTPSKVENKVKAIRTIEMLKKISGISIEFDVENYDYDAPGAWIIEDLFKEAIKIPQIYATLKEENPLLVEHESHFLRKGLNNIYSKAYVDMSDKCASLAQIRDFCDKTGALMFLAHPFEYGEVVTLVLDEAKNYVDGIEMYHPTADAQKRKFLEEFAKEHNLMVSGGGDYHGFKGELNSEEVPFDIYKNILDKVSVKV